MQLYQVFLRKRWKNKILYQTRIYDHYHSCLNTKINYRIYSFTTEHFLHQVRMFASYYAISDRVMQPELIRYHLVQLQSQKTLHRFVKRWHLSLTSPKSPWLICWELWVLKGVEMVAIQLLFSSFKTNYSHERGKHIITGENSAVSYLVLMTMQP